MARGNLAPNQPDTAGMETPSVPTASPADELREERRLRQRAQADVVNLLSVLASARLADAGISTADLALIDRIERRWIGGGQ